ncbi:hypothetical protein EK21DRAFT_74805 [Setomelanomma holmii]|uniref:ABM domain-containing protein n=1 Tax=Setomelanomma holmii TaxID=210430 RepID=A0A9P4LI61_9PLEO|nr:hypothetical protein EK21DRAFT_74805 [Setomelanomma holmii]
MSPVLITSIHVTIRVAPADAPAFLAALKRAHTVVATLPEHVSFELYQHPNEPGTYKYIENWNASAAWIMKAAAENEACQEYFCVTEKMYVQPKEMEVWTRMEG